MAKQITIGTHPAVISGPYKTPLITSYYVQWDTPERALCYRIIVHTIYPDTYILQRSWPVIHAATLKDAIIATYRFSLERKVLCT